MTEQTPAAVALQLYARLLQSTPLHHAAQSLVADSLSERTRNDHRGAVGRPASGPSGSHDTTITTGPQTAAVDA